MFQFGRNINNLNDKLETVSLKHLINLIKYTPQEIKELKNQIENIRHIDKNKFREALALLPYFTPGIYNPPYRKSENFGCINYMLAVLNPYKKIYDKIIKTEEITCAFRLIEENKILIIIKLDEPIYDGAIYEFVSKKFLKNFISINFPESENNYRVAEPGSYFHITHDRNLYTNENALSINICGLIDENEFYRKEKTKRAVIPKTGTNLTEEILNFVRERTGIRKRSQTAGKRYLMYYEKFDRKKERIFERLKAFDYGQIEVKNIFRGRKIILNSDKKGFCEVNIFITDSGFKITGAVRKDMNKEKLEEAKIILRQELLLKP